MALSAKDLRIGNLVKAVHKKSDILNSYIVIEGKHICDLENGKCDFDFYGIPITEERLLKFGFKHVSENYYYKNLVLKFKFFKNGRFDIYIFNNVTGLSKKIKYIHQLQNLYFALTQTELEIK